VRRPFLLFDKSSLESLSTDEAALLSHFFSCVITPVFFVECLADLAKTLTRRSRGTQESLVASLAKRTPDHEDYLSIHHMDLLEAEFANTPLPRLRGGPFPPQRKQVQLGDHTGMIFQATDEQEAMIRWMDFRFLEAERKYAKAWREQLAAINLSDRVERLKACIGNHWRRPHSLDDALAMTNVIIDYIDPVRLLGYGLDLFGLDARKDSIISDWTKIKRPPIRERFRQLVHMMAVNICFSLLLPTRLLSNVKESHVVDLAYLYYLPYCSAFTSKDDFHVKIAPLFLAPDQTFVKGDDLKADLKKLDSRYTALDQSELDKGLEGFARFPPDDDFLTTRLWDKHVPQWRNAKPPIQLNEQLQGALKEMVDRLLLSTDDTNPGVTSIKQLDFIKFEGTTRLQVGKYHRFSKELEERIIASEQAKGATT
jgi:hypothetical protein